jgi:hypothetical protein
LVNDIPAGDEKICNLFYNLGIFVVHITGSAECSPISYHDLQEPHRFVIEPSSPGGYCTINSSATYSIQVPIPAGWTSEKFKDLLARTFTRLSQRYMELKGPEHDIWVTEFFTHS